MKKILAIVFCASMLTCAAAAQTKMLNMQWKCDKATNQHAIDIGDKPGHSYAVQQVNCTPTNGDFNGMKRKSAVATEFMEMDGNHYKGHGTFVETMENGDTNFYTYTTSGMTKDGSFVGGSNKFTLRSAGGKLKGAKFSGICKGSPSGDQSAWDCSGEFIVAAKK